MNANVLEDDIFAFYMSMSMNTTAEDSEVTFGVYDESRIDNRRNNGEIEWHDVRHKLFWSIQLDDI